MSSDEITLLRKIEETCAGIGMKASFADVARPLPVSGVSGRISSIPSPLINLVGLAALTEANVDDKIQQVIELYRREGTIFGWLVGPTSQPVNLRERLVAAGFTPLEEEAMWGMVLRDLKRPIPVNPDIRVERVPIEALYANVAVIAQAYGFSMTEETVVMLGRLYESLGEQASLYLAFAPDREGPVAFSSSVVDDEGRVVMLGGAATLEVYRGKGIYSSMVAKRLEDARAQGMTSAVIQALKGTSAPICAKLGFEIVCPLDFYLFV